MGAWSQLSRADLTNAAGENYFINRLPELKKYDPYGSGVPHAHAAAQPPAVDGDTGRQRPHPTENPRGHRRAGRRRRGTQAGDYRGSPGKDFLDMTISQAILWAAHNIAPEERPSEVVLAEPYIMGSHSGESGAWVSGPEDVSPDGYHWGYSKMTTVAGLFAAGDGVGACPHKFSSGLIHRGTGWLESQP